MSSGYWAIFGVPLVLMVVGFGVVWWERRQRVVEAVVLAGGGMRLAGESVRLRLRRIDAAEQAGFLDAAILLALGSVLLVGLNLVMPRDVGPWVALAATAGLVPFFCGKMRRLRVLADERRQYALWWEGDRLATEQLQRLGSRGCRVVHEVSVPGLGLIDHVVVAPEGVFAVEVRARSLPAPGGDPRPAVYDGHSIAFPGGDGPEPVRQAQLRAAWLERRLAHVLTRAIRVQAVVVVPGWSVRYASPAAEHRVQVVDPAVFGPALLDPMPVGFDSRVVGHVARRIEELAEGEPAGRAGALTGRPAASRRGRRMIVLSH